LQDFLKEGFEKMGKILAETMRQKLKSSEKNGQKWKSSSFMCVFK
jgi:hypothetical protein